MISSIAHYDCTLLIPAISLSVYYYQPYPLKILIKDTTLFLSYNESTLKSFKTMLFL